MSNLRRFLALTLAMLMVVGAMVTASAKSFEDVAATDSYAEAVDVLSELGVIVGTSADEFSPEVLVERQQMAMFIARLATAQPALFAGSAGAVFADQTAPVYNAAIAYANANGFVKGTSATTFNGADSVTLQEAATMLARVLGYGNKSNDAAYPFSYMVLANEIGLLAGLEDVAPTAALSRGEVAIMLYNAMTAPKAERELLYTPDGQDWIVSVPQKFYDKDTSFDKLASRPWNFKTIASYIVATKDFTFGSTTANPSKAISDPVIVKNYNDEKVVSFAAIAKYLPEDSVANDMLGVDLSILARGNSILKIDVVGDKTTTSDVKYDNADGKQIVTVNGVAYNLAAYKDDYPVGDNCFYMYNTNKIERIDAAAVPATFEQIKTGYFIAEIINEDAATQKIVFKPLSFGQVKDDAGTLKLNGVAVTSLNGAVADSYVVYFSNGTNLVEVIAVATKTAESEAVQLNVNAKTITLKDGQVIPTAGTDIKLPGATFAEVKVADLGAKYFAYVVDGKAVKTEKVGPPAAVYTPKNYYKVIGTSVTESEFTGALTSKILVVDASGVESVKVITKVNGVDLATSGLEGAQLALKNKFDVDGDITKSIIVFDPADANNVITRGNAGFIGDTESIDYANDDDGIKVTRTGSNVYRITKSPTDTFVATFVLADYSKAVVKAKDGYATFSGKSNVTIADQKLQPAFVVYNTNAAGVKELVYAYMGSPDKEKAAVFGSTTPTTTLKPYVFLNIEAETATTVTYNVFNAATGAVEQVTYTGSDADAKTAIKNSIVEAKNNNVKLYDVQSFTGKPTEIGVSGKTIFATGYVVDKNGTPYNTVATTKYYEWSVADQKLVEKAVGDFTAGAIYEGVVYSASNNDATYVIIWAKDVVANVTATPAAGAVEADTEVTLSTTTDGATIYYTTDGSAPTTSSTKYEGKIKITAGVTIKAFAVKAGMLDSDVAEFVYTLST